MKILITGANGLLGQKLVDIFQLSPEYHVMATSKSPKKFQLEYANLNFKQLDITSSNEVKHLLSSFQPDIVINTAAISQVDDCELNPAFCRRVNVDGVRNLIKFSIKSGTFLIHLSTDFIFDGADGPYREEDKPNPISVYGKCKLESEQILQSSMRNYAIIRTVLVFGVLPNMSRSNIVLWVKESLEQGKEIRVVTDQFRTPTLAEDLAKGCKLVAETKTTGIFHISGNDWMSPYELAIRTARFFDLNETLIKTANSSNFSQPAKRPQKTGFIIDKAKNVLGYNPLSFEEGLGLIREQMSHSQ